MLKNIIKKFNSYRKKLKNNSLEQTKVEKNFNPFVNNQHSAGIAENLIMLMDRTPEEEEAIHQRIMNMAKLMMHPYIQEEINDSVSKFTHISQKENYYYEVHKVRMTEEQYQQYLDKKALNEKLYKKLPARTKEKRAKL